MSRDDRRKLMDPQFVEKLRARLVRIRMQKVSRDTERHADQWEALPTNWIESAYLRQQLRTALRQDSPPEGDTP